MSSIPTTETLHTRAAIRSVVPAFSRLAFTTVFLIASLGAMPFVFVGGKAFDPDPMVAHSSLLGHGHVDGNWCVEVAVWFAMAPWVRFTLVVMLVLALLVIECLFAQRHIPTIVFHVTNWFALLALLIQVLAQLSVVS
jgi:hypothetical protein